MNNRLFDDEWKAKKIKELNASYKDYTIRTKTAISSIGFKFSKPYIFNHNTRDEIKELEAKYVNKDLSNLNEYSCSVDEAKQTYYELLKEAKQNYYERTKQKIQTKDEKLRISAVINLNEHHTLKDVQRVAMKIQERFGVQVLQYAIHRDEGHYLKNSNDELIKDENGKAIWDMNLHAHIEFFALDKQGINRYKKRDWYKMGKELQDIAANELGMQRGKDYAKNNEKAPKGLNRRQYAAKKAMQDRQKAKIADLNQINSSLRASFKELGASRADYAKIEQDKKDLLEKIRANELSIKELRIWQEQSINELKKQKELNEILKDQNDNLKNQNQSLNAKNKDLEQENAFYKQSFDKAQQAIQKTQEMQSGNADIYEFIGQIAKKCASSDAFRREINSKIFDELSKDNKIVREFRQAWQRDRGR